ncbi:hypothetical protein ABZ639_24305 [Saccharomonospora sp. NPDC006951]
MPTDAELVAAVLMAEQPGQSARGRSPVRGVGPAIGADAALAEIYDRYADRLYALFLRALPGPDAAGEAVRDTFVLAVRRMGGMRDPSALWSLLISAASDVLDSVGDASGKAAETWLTSAVVRAPAWLRADVLARAGLRRPPAVQGRRISIAVAGAAALLVAGGVVIWSARTDPPAIPESTSGPSPATTKVSAWARDDSVTRTPTRLTVVGCGTALTSDC